MASSESQSNPPQLDPERIAHFTYKPGDIEIITQPGKTGAGSPDQPREPWIATVAEDTTEPIE